MTSIRIAAEQRQGRAHRVAPQLQRLAPRVAEHPPEIEAAPAPRDLLLGAGPPCPSGPARLPAPPARSLLQVADKGSSRVAAPRLSTSAAGASLTSTRPAFISEMRSQRSASFMKWVEMKIVTSSLRDKLDQDCQNASRATGSTPEVGSSRISISGW